tara:strand:- start:1956 stop:2264 length:309 start_codon:yes stop_codon:yes gene_type:complete
MVTLKFTYNRKENKMGIIYNLETDEEQLPPNVMLANDYYYCEYDVADDVYIIFNADGYIQWEYEYDGTVSRQRILQLAKKEMERLEFEDIEMQAIAEIRAGV